MAESMNNNNSIKHPLTNGTSVEPPAVRRKGWSVPASNESRGAVNTIRLCEEQHFKEAMNERDTSKELIKLSIGDPTVFGNLPPDPAIAQAVKDAIDTGDYNGYGHSSGLLHVREAIARKFSPINKSHYKSSDVIMTCSCSGAIDLCISALVNAGQNILVPKPGFALYSCLAGAKLADIRYYKLKPEDNWEADIDHMETLVDNNTAAIIVNNPSNPCGSVYSKEHVREIAEFAARHYLPIISDEIYAEMIFPGHTFHSIASVDVPVPSLICGGVSKQYLIPGWRLGWIIINDPVNAFKDEVREGLSKLAMKILGPSTIVQAAVPQILQTVPQSFHERNVSLFYRNAQLVYEGLKSVAGLNPIMPAGAMYLMVGIDIAHFHEFNNDIDFTKQLLIEQSVFCLPGDAFQCPNFFRVVLVMPPDKIADAIKRITEFCSTHYQ